MIRSWKAAGVATLVLAAGMLSGGVAAAGCPEPGGTGRYVEIPDADLFSTDPPFMVVVGGGSTPMSSCANVPGDGWARSMPHFELGLQEIAFGSHGGGALLIEAHGDCVSFLLVLDSYGAWHFGRATADYPLPQVSLNDPRSGLHSIWIGSSVPGECTAALRFSTIVFPD